jgi:small subunit ribosomal protein S7
MLFQKALFNTRLIRHKSNFKLEKSLKRQEQLQDQAVVEQFVNHIMKSGLKQRARRTISDTLHHLKHSSKEEQKSAQEIFEEAIDKVSPLVKTKSTKMNGKNQLFPKPLSQRQSRRIGIDWIAIEATKRKGDYGFGERIGVEMLKIMDGTSTLFAKRENVHKQALANRSNLVLVDRKR